MTMPGPTELRLEHADPSRRIRAIVLPPAERDGGDPDPWSKQVTFKLPGAEGREPQEIEPYVRYLKAIDVSKATSDAAATATVARMVATDARPDWHVKVYRCRTRGEAKALLKALALQAEAIREANLAVNQSDPLDPPWGIVPVVIAPGNAVLKRLGAEFGTQSDERADPPSAVKLPAWFLLPGWEPNECVFALSPYVDPLPFRDYQTGGPAVQHLRMFEDLAIVLDTLHNGNVQHCDVKPDNVRLVQVLNKSSYALVDTDAVSIALTELRLTRAYTYRPLLWHIEVKQDPPEKVLRAQDRFGFALVVLSALAGKQWVHSHLLTPPLRGGRPVDDHEKVRERLQRRWLDSDTRKLGPLIDALVEPFEQQRIEDPQWTCVDWLERLSRPGPRSEPRDQKRFKPYLAAIKDTTAQSDQAGLTRAGVVALRRAAQEVALTAARRHTVGWALLVVLPMLALAFSYLAQRGK